MGVWATVRGVRAMILERVRTSWDGDEHYRVLYSRDQDGNLAPHGVHGIVPPEDVIWDSASAPRMVKFRAIEKSEKPTEKEIQELEEQWGDKNG